MIFYFFCRRIILNNFSSDLHNVTNDMLSFLEKKERNFVFVVVSLIVTFTNFQLALALHFIKTFTNQKISTIFLFCVLLIIIFMFVISVFTTQF